MLDPDVWLVLRLEKPIKPTASMGIKLRAIIDLLRQDSFDALS